MKRRLILLLILLLAIVLAAWAFWFEPSSIRVKNHSLTPPGWSENLAGLRIAVLADLHVGSPGNGVGKLKRIVRLTNEAAPDLILLAGDFVIHGVVGGSFVEPEEIAEHLQDLSAPLGVFAVLGNHDWWLGARRVREALEGRGIPVLDDRGLRIRHGGESFWLVGISDLWEGPHNVEYALSVAKDDRPVIAFTHNPDLFAELPGRINLTIAAHTHGGQVYIPGVGRPIVPSEYGARYVIGTVIEEGRHLFVSPGIGTSILPVRFLVPPEISLLRLERGSTTPE